MKFRFKRDSSGVVKLEYMMLIGAAVVLIPVIAGVTKNFIDTRNCDTSIALGTLSDCYQITLTAENHNLTTYEGVAVEGDILAGSAETVETGALSRPLYGVAFANTPNVPSMRSNDYIRVNRDNSDRSPPPGIRLDWVEPPRLSRVNASRAISLPGNGTHSVVNGSRLRFDPQSDFNELRSGESAFVSLGYGILGSEDVETQAEVTVEVRGFHADDDTVTLYRGVTESIDVLANDHLPGERNLLTISSVSTSDDSVASVNQDGTISFTPGSSFDGLASGNTGTSSFSYTVTGPMGVTDTATVSLTVRGFDVNDDIVATYREEPIYIDVLANDNGGDRTGMTITAVTAPSRGSVRVVNNQILFEPAVFQAPETISFSYTATGPDGNVTGTAGVSVQVRDFSYTVDYGPWGACSGGGTFSDWSAWSGCPSCGTNATESRSRTCLATGTQTRSATCTRSDGVQVDLSFCSNVVLSQACSTTCTGPSYEERACSVPSCYTYSWQTSGWGSCSATASWGGWSSWSICGPSCGSGTQTRSRSCNGSTSGVQSRSVQCVRSDGVTVSDSLCTGPRPSSTISCSATCSGSSTESRSCFADCNAIIGTGSCTPWSFPYAHPCNGFCGGHWVSEASPGVWVGMRGPNEVWCPSTWVFTGVAKGSLNYPSGSVCNADGPYWTGQFNRTTELVTPYSFVCRGNPEAVGPSICSPDRTGGGCP